MSAWERLYLIAYDVADDKARTNLAKFLEGYGVRIQFSLFEARLTPGELKEVLAEAGKRIDTRFDRFDVYPIRADDIPRIRSVGRKRPDSATREFYLVT